MERAFNPAVGGTKSITVGAASARVFIYRQNGPMQVRVVNDGTATVWIRAGGSAVAATTSDIPVLAGTIEVLTFAPDEGSDLYLAAIAAGATGTIYFTPGSGI